MSGSRLRFLVPAKPKNERDEELALFRELLKRERERNMNLLDAVDAVSTELEPAEGFSVLYKTSPAKKGDKYESEKQDYNWLKTPPATPLFQSLEIELAQANPNLAVQKELPIIPSIKLSRFSEKREEPRRLSVSKPMVSQPVASWSRPETPHLDTLSPPRTFRAPLTTSITTPRFARAHRFVKESDKGVASVKPPQTRQFLSKKEEVSATAASRLETPDVNPKPLHRSTTAAPGKTDPNPAERYVKRTNRETPEMQKKLERKLQPALFKADVIKSRSLPETRNSYPDPKPREIAVRKTTTVAATAKQYPESKPNSRTVSPMTKSRFPASLPGFSDEAPPNLITTVAPGRATSATRTRPGAPAMGLVEQRRTASVTKDRSTAAEATGEQEKGKEKSRGGRISGMLIGSSMVEKMMNARRSAAAGKARGREDKASKVRVL